MIRLSKIREGFRFNELNRLDGLYDRRSVVNLGAGIAYYKR